MSCKLSHDLMDAYLDGELDLVRALEMEQHLKECLDCSHTYERRRSLITVLKTTPLDYAVPSNLQRDIRAAIHREALIKPSLEHASNKRAWPGNVWLYGLAPIGALALMILFAIVPHFYDSSLDERLGQEVVSAHVRSLMAGHLTDIGNSNHHVVKPWFNGRLDFSPPVRDFSDHGFVLAGGRLDYLNGRPVAAIVYYRAAHPINLFVWPTQSMEAKQEKAFMRQGYHLSRWSEGGMMFWVISDLNEKELKDFIDLLGSPPQGAGRSTFS